MAAHDTSATVPEVIPPGLGQLGQAFAMLGLPDPTELLAELTPDPDAPQLADVIERLDAIDSTLDDVVEALRALAPLLDVVRALRANQGKLRAFGIKLPD